MTQFTPQLLNALREEAENEIRRGNRKEADEMFAKCMELGLNYLEQRLKESPELLELFEADKNPVARILAAELRRRREQGS
tara:strand:- start:980 stop:1222 length:243 start_codon:yes stop_codon:yes gene_type:complete